MIVSNNNLELHIPTHIPTVLCHTSSDSDFTKFKSYRTSGSTALQPRVAGVIINQTTSTNHVFFTKWRKSMSTVIQRKLHLEY